jgi:hypothetical protein
MNYFFFKSIIKRLSVVSLFFLVFSCKKDDRGAGLGLLEDGDYLNVQYVDTFQASAYTLPFDSIITSNQSALLLGVLNDPIFGQSRAAFSLQFRIPSSNLDWGTPNISRLDSIVLQLKYETFYGENTTPQSFYVYELDEDLESGKTYYSKKVSKVKPQIIGQLFNHRPNFEDSIKIGNNRIPPHMRIKLSNTFGNKILVESRSSKVANNVNFTQFLKGLKVVAESRSGNDQGAILQINPLSSVTKITMYYKRDNDTIQQFQDFVSNSASIRFSEFSFNYQGTEVEQQLNDTTLGRQKIYLQSMGGVRPRITFPTLKNFLQNNQIVVNKAELIVPIDLFNTNTIKYRIPERLILFGYTADGPKTLTFDPNNPGESNLYYFSSFSESTRSFSFLLTRHLAAVSKDLYSDNGYVILPEAGAINANRCIIFGPNSQESRIRIKLTYTKLN